MSTSGGHSRGRGGVCGGAELRRPSPGGATVQSRHARPGPEGWSCTAWSGRPRGHCPGLAAETRPGLVDWCPATSQCQMAHRGGTWWFALGWPALVWVVMLGQGRTLCSLRAGIPRPLRLAGEVTAMEAGAGDTRGCRACGPVAAAHVPCKLSSAARLHSRLETGLGSPGLDRGCSGGAAALTKQEWGCTAPFPVLSCVSSSRTVRFAPARRRGSRGRGPVAPGAGKTPGGFPRGPA